MHFDKALYAPAFLKDDQDCRDAFSRLIEQIADLPAELRGIQALSLSSQLVELAAYELAGTLDSEQIGALIKCAADLAERSSEVAEEHISSVRPGQPVLQ